MGVLSQDAFLNELTKLYESNKDKGSVVITIKQVYPKTLNKSRGKDDKLLVSGEKQEPRCLVRAIGGNKKKLSTIVAKKDQLRFHGMFSNIIKVHMDSLKKRDKKKKRATQNKSTSK
mmetsp:Transcript_8686/g.10973  ORF Transcript_8686/g.10973 Transcript_8686/m.10973 type:complete len:117 (+) Transcript_8686:80-430(+)|eukprot:CAMPEP_0204823330 /NCGR_PEP_ID=MMETSP1346-20131115/1375_1 /ASSEMBLY_ACC=CAM_ASM_000771 /TAXON_ID=215587 /ORGANISM="Aplanochytrium stocchinoi, Strain GSBS06" /LENGTH=116 /DNA_ID=CAMNT_0051949913 /DNA_START=169 /DNA_END=519 /DNA_ORIENTATION=+